MFKFEGDNSIESANTIKQQRPGRDEKSELAVAEISDCTAAASDRSTTGRRIAVQRKANQSRVYREADWRLASIAAV